MSKLEKIEETLKMRTELVNNFKAQQSQAKDYQKLLKDAFGIDEEDKVKMDVYDLALHFKEWFQND